MTRLGRRGGTPQLSPAGEVSPSSPRGRDDTGPGASSRSDQMGTETKIIVMLFIFISGLFYSKNVECVINKFEKKTKKHLNIYEVVLGRSQHITRLLEAVDTYYEYPAGPLPFDLT